MPDATPSVPAATITPAVTPAVTPRPAAPGGGPVRPMITLQNVDVRLHTTHAVRNVTGSVAHGEWVALIGANGAGKTTLLRAIAHLEHYDGTIRVNGRLTRNQSRRQRAQLVAHVPQKPELPAEMTVTDYTLLGRTPHASYFGAVSARDRRHCTDLLERLGLRAVASRCLSTLSGGELQRVVLCRALAQDTPVLLLDEPTSALDLGQRVDALEVVDELRRERELTVLSAMHDLTLAAQFADRLVLLAGGAVVASGSPAEVMEETLLSTHFGGPIRVLVTDNGERVVVPQRTTTRTARPE